MQLNKQHITIKKGSKIIYDHFDSDGNVTGDIYILAEDLYVYPEDRPEVEDE
jgi:hypothetical protein